MVGALMILLLRCHVLRRAGGLRLREADARIIAHHLRDAEVGNLHPPALVEQQIRRLDVAMNDAVLVRVLQRVAQRRDDSEGFLRRELLGLQQLAQVHAIHELHEEEIKPPRLPEIINGDDVGMIQGREGVGLARESLGELGIRHALRCEQLERDQTIQ